MPGTKFNSTSETLYAPLNKADRSLSVLVPSTKISINLTLVLMDFAVELVLNWICLSFSLSFSVFLSLSCYLGKIIAFIPFSVSSHIPTTLWTDFLLFGINIRVSKPKFNPKSFCNRFESNLFSSGIVRDGKTLLCVCVFCFVWCIATTKKNYKLLQCERASEWQCDWIFGNNERYRKREREKLTILGKCVLRSHLNKKDWNETR